MGINIDGRSQSGCPGVVQKRPEFDVVVGMVMCDENVSQRREPHTGFEELECNTVTSINHVRHALVHEQICRRARRYALTKGSALGLNVPPSL